MTMSPDWINETRFFLPNEDAEVARRALALLPTAPRHVLAVTGSGMLALDMLTVLGPADAVLECIDVSPAQRDFMDALVDAASEARSPEDMRRWFAVEVYPRLAAHYERRGQKYPMDGVLHALRRFLHVSWFLEPESFSLVHSRLGSVVNGVGDMCVRVREHDYDFVHLSNITDYLSAEALRGLFQETSAAKAPVFFVETSACPDAAGLAAAWREAGYVPAPESEELDQLNRALGSLTPERAWMRTGHVRFLLPA